jgi:type I restriction enzyme, R subunit
LSGVGFITEGQQEGSPSSAEPDNLALNARGTELLSANFGFLEPHGAQLYRLAALAEVYFPTDANTCLLKLRQFAELLAQDVAARASLFTSMEEPFVDLLGRLSRSGYVPRQALDLFHHLRKAGNAAAHVNHDDHQTPFQLSRSREN